MKHAIDTILFQIKASRRSATPRRKGGFLLAVLLIFSIILGGCEGIVPLPAGNATPVDVSPDRQSKEDGDALSLTPTPQPSPTPPVISLWLPPQFDPEGDSPAAALLQARLDTFVSRNPGVQVVVRVKDVGGPAGLLESLTAASAVAPEAVPSLVLLSRADMETAALKGLIVPQNGLTSINEDDDWYSFARQMASIQDHAFGLPFAADVLLLVYRPHRLGIVPLDWGAVLRLGQAVAFPAADLQALVSLTLYQSTGGILMDAQRRPMLQTEELTRLLTFYAEGARLGSFPAWLSQLQNDDQAWEAFIDQRSHNLITWSSYYLRELPVDSSAAPLPVLGEKALTLGRGWLWCLSDPLPERRILSMRLAEYLVDSEFLALWSASAGYLPPRPSALDGWTNQSLSNMLDQIALSAKPRPANDLTASLGPVLRDATLQVIRNQSDPAEVARTAVDELNIP